MIARIWHGATAASNADAYLDFLISKGTRDYRSTPGNRGVRILRNVTVSHADFLLISLWDSLAALHAFAGPDIERAVYYPEDHAYLLDFEPNVAHYEVAADLPGLATHDASAVEPWP
jgi:heme-degrading monooxygenase HmoA